MKLSVGSRKAAHAAAGRGQDASKSEITGKDEERIVKYGGRVSARLRTQPLGVARMLAKQKLMAGMQTVSQNYVGQVSAWLDWERPGC